MNESPDRKQNNIILSVAFSQFVTPFMFSGVGVTLPSLALELHATGIHLGLIESVYMGVTAAVLLPMGKIADLTDKRTIFKTGLVFFTILMVLLGLTQNIELFIGLRLLQGLAGGMLLATNMAILTELIPRQNLGKAIGLAVGAVYLGLTTGPFVAGIVTTNFGWRFVYFFGALLLGITTWISFRNIPSTKKMQFVKIDFWGTLLIITTIALFVSGSASLKSARAGYTMML